MGAFNAAAKYVIPTINKEESHSGLPDCVVSVGDGMTPRTAAMFAYRLPGWESYSIDPLLSENAIKTKKNDLQHKKKDTFSIKKGIRAKWNSIRHLHYSGELIQNVRIRCNRLILVLVHCHVSIKDCLQSIECNKFSGCICIPCCNYFEVQKDILSIPPFVEYADNKILSDKNTVRVWTEQQLVEYHNDYFLKPHYFVIPDQPLTSEDLHLQATNLTRELLYEKAEGHVFPWEGEEVVLMGYVRVIRRYGNALYFMGITKTREEDKKNDINLKFHNAIMKESWSTYSPVIESISNDSLIYIHGHISVCINNKPTINVKSIQLLIKGDDVRNGPLYLCSPPSYEEIASFYLSH